MATTASQSAPPAANACYQCPGERSPISRALHLARLASLYPACSGCACREDVVLISSRHARQLESAHAAATERAASLFHAEGLTGVYLNQLGPTEARQAGQSLGSHLLSYSADRLLPPTAVMGCDGRAWTIELAAAVADGLRWAGCRVIDIGAATSAVVALACEQFAADGGALVGNSGGDPRHVSVSLFGVGGEPMSSPGQLDSVTHLYHSPAPRPNRSFGAIEHRSVTAEYLAPLKSFYHALRPLRLLIDTTSPAVKDMVSQLTATVALDIRWSTRGGPMSWLSDQVRATGAHFGAWIDGDGERCQLIDELGQSVAAERLFALLAKAVGPSPALPCFSAPVHVNRAGMFQLIAQRPPALAADREGRFWFGDKPRSADALRTLTLLLALLSGSDRPLSDHASSAIL